MMRRSSAPFRFTRLLLAGALIQGGLALTAPPASAAAPQTTIMSGPSGLIASRSATFKFKANVASAKFQCKLDSGSWKGCTSPKKYTKLAQGEHTFSVRGTKNGVVDRTPATRSFTVDTIKPQTTVDRHFFSTRVVVAVVRMDFTADEEATFECRLNSAPFETCVSPFYPEVLPDRKYTFEVRARDTAGNVDTTPGVEQFDKVPLMSFSQETGAVAAEYFIPDELVLDVPPTCGGSPALDCPDGNPTAPSDQVSIDSTRTVTKNHAGSRYDVSGMMDVNSLQPFTLTHSGADCLVTLDSSNGTTPTWSYSVSLSVVTGMYSDFEPERFISRGDPQVTMEDQDYTLTGDFMCQLASFIPRSMIEGVIETLLADRMPPLCMAAGPPLFETCPWAGQVPLPN